MTDDGTSYGSGQMAWTIGALCQQVDPTLFSPGKGQSDLVRQAKWICGRCESLAACQDYAMAHRELVGVWGQMTARERTARRRKEGTAMATHEPDCPHGKGHGTQYDCQCRWIRVGMDAERERITKTVKALPFMSMHRESYPHEEYVTVAAALDAIDGVKR
jgi:WhiB family redox-sensing transcriptional regulator